MLQAIRTRAGGIVVKTLFGILILSFGIWGIYTRSPFSDHSTDAVVATVGDHEIRAVELQKAIDAALERLRGQIGSIDRQQLKQLGIVDTLLQQLIDRSLLDQEVARLRLDVSDDVIRSTVYENPAFRTPDGRFDPNLYQQFLIMSGMTEDQLITRLRSEIPSADLVQAATLGTVGPRDVAVALYRYRNEKRVADMVAFPVASVTGIGDPSDDELNKFYQAHQELFRAPEYRGFTVLSLTTAEVAKGIQIPEERVRREYEERKDELTKPEQRQVEQIVAPSEEKAKEAEAALAAGKDWKEVATTIAGQDPETIELGLLKREEMPKELADVAFSLPLNKPSDPIRSPLGWHILRVVKIEPQSTPTYEEVKQKISEALALEAAATRLDDLEKKVNDALAGGMSVADAAAKFGMTVTAVAAADAGGRDPDGKPIALPINPPTEILKAAFETEAERTSRVDTTDDGSIFAVRVDKVTPPHVRALTEVKAPATAAWQADQKRQAAAKQAAALAGAVKPDAPLAKVAADQHVTVTTPPPIGRRAEPGAAVPAALVAKLFRAKPGEVVTAEDDSGAYVAQLKEVQAPEAPADAALQPLTQELAGAVKRDLVGEFTQALRARFPVSIKRDVIDRLF